MRSAFRRLSAAEQLPSNLLGFMTSLGSITRRSRNHATREPTLSLKVRLLTWRKPACNASRSVAPDKGSVRWCSNPLLRLSALRRHPPQWRLVHLATQEERPAADRCCYPVVARQVGAAWRRAPPGRTASSYAPSPQMSSSARGLRAYFHHRFHVRFHASKERSGMSHACRELPSFRSSPSGT